MYVCIAARTNMHAHIHKHTHVAHLQVMFYMFCATFVAERTAVELLEPDFGPTTGGTLVLIQGQHLLAEDDPQVYLNTVPCNVTVR